jgi:hypothetical protein
VQFPSDLDVIGVGGGASLVAGPLLLVLSAAIWIYLIRRGKGPDRSANRKVIFFGIISGLVGTGHTIGAYGEVWNARAFRFDPAQVAEIGVHRAPRESERSEEWWAITDRTAIRDGLALLETCTRYRRNHEMFSDGFRLEIVIPGERDRFLWVYRKTSRRDEPAAIVVPRASRLGNAEYSCPAFVDWVTSAARAQNETPEE